MYFKKLLLVFRPFASCSSDSFLASLILLLCLICHSLFFSIFLCRFDFQFLKDILLFANNLFHSVVQPQWHFCGPLIFLFGIYIKFEPLLWCFKKIAGISLLWLTVTIQVRWSVAYYYCYTLIIQTWNLYPQGFYGTVCFIKDFYYIWLFSFTYIPFFCTLWNAKSVHS